MLAFFGFFFDHTYQSRYFDLRIVARLLKPRVLVGSVIHHQVDQHAQAALLASLRELDEIAQRAVPRIDAVVVGDVVSIVACRAKAETASARSP